MVWNAGLGHAHPRMRKALADAAGRGLLVTPNAAFPAKLRAAELLTEVTPPGLEKTFFCLSGAEANENAVKIARLVTGRKKIVARNRSYHGATLAMLSLSGDPRREPFEPGLPGVVRMGDPYCFRCPFGKEPTSCAHECAAGSGDRAAARGAGHRRRRDPGGRRRRQRRVHAPGRLLEEGPRDLRSPRRAADRRRGAVGLRAHRPLVRGRPRRRHARPADDGQGDHGRLRPRRRGDRHRPRRPPLRRERAGVRPDQLRAPAGVRGDRRRDRDLPRRGAGRRGRRRRAPGCGPAFADFARQRPYLGEVRGIGLLWAFELCAPGTRTPLPSVTMAKVAAALRRNHLHMHKRDNLVYFAPPLVITDAELDEAIAARGRGVRRGDAS